MINLKRDCFLFCVFFDELYKRVRIEIEKQDTHNFEPRFNEITFIVSCVNSILIKLSKPLQFFFKLLLYRKIRRQREKICS